MAWYCWLALAYVLVSLAIGGFAAAIAWDYNPWEAFWVAAVGWPVLLAAFVFG